MPLATVMSFFQNVYKVKVRKSLSHCLLMCVSVSHLILRSVIEYWSKTLFYRVSQLSVVDADADIEDELSTDSDTCAPRASWPPCCCSWGVYSNGITYWAERAREREREREIQHVDLLCNIYFTATATFGFCSTDTLFHQSLEFRLHPVKVFQKIFFVD